MQLEFSNKVQNMKPSIIRELLKQMADPRLISFAGGNPSNEAFPAKEIADISARLLRDDPAGVLQYSITEGYPSLRQRGKEYLNRFEEAVKDTDEIIVLSGSQQSMDYLSKLLCNDGDFVVTEDPAFLGAMNSFRANGAELIGVPLEEDGVCLAALEAALSRTPKPKFYYTIPNFQNPTGYTTSLEKRKAVYEMCKKYGVMILEDNPYGELRFTKEDIPSIKSFDTEGLVVYAVSLSKVFAPGMRIALCVAEKNLMNKFVVVKQGNDVHTNMWGQKVIDEFLAEHDITAHIAKIREVYKKKAYYMMDAFKSELSDKTSFVPVEGGMFLWLRMKNGIDAQEFVQKCLDEKLAVVPGSAFFVDATKPCDAVRCNFSTPSFEQIDAGTAIMKKVLASM